MKGRHIESALATEDWPRSDEEDLAIFLEMTRQTFIVDPTNSVSALETIAFLAAFHWRREEEREEIMVPFWVVEAVASGYLQYKDSHQDSGRSRLTLGEAFQVEGRGQGKRPRIHETLKQLRDIRLATYVAWLEEEGWKVDAALEEAAAKAKMHHSSVRDIWALYAAQA